ncbi:cell wall-associated NlpC family hydrolase/soluble lytic murein transglycosylase-like protein [Kineosphaera limosa]|uniref:Putative transglycosylase n=1 Tax=Kineosphaera limosa NBRC 100340 TaxID=1184609 RepID=K6X157_9MICO|nr:transglycosylase SLT domain-containing protein [Kineosphaera limosa]NYD99819.1 cell wall-associated NlpC family hydrolase/soluble lytic murein transglycosylase-like protein [Kineosphaera limosa]GAB98107.1 putative transglycosylase [Kineosphaera limosa NBRC 100340]
MTVEVTGIASAQARVQELQARFAGASGASAASSNGVSGGSNTAMSTATSASSSGSSAGSFGASLAKASAIAAVNAAPATLDAPFVWSPQSGPGDIEWKPGGQQAVAEPPPVPASTRTPASSSEGVAPVAPVSGPAPTGSVDPVDSVAGVARTDRLIATAKKYLGIPYVWGGTNPNVGLDCSGFTQLVYRQHGVDLPRVARDQQKVGTRIGSLADAKPGDLLFFGEPATHVTMYLGDNKMIHAPRRGRNVSIDSVYRTPTTIRRYLPEGSDVAASSVASPASARAATQSTTSAAQAAEALQAARSAQFASASAALGTGSSLGGWAGATPAPDTWGAAVAAAAAQGVDGLLPSPAVATPAVASTAGFTAPAATRAVSGAGPLAKSPAYLQPMFEQAERKYGVSAELLAAIAKQESNFKTRAVSHAGARGLMQLMPGTARGLGVRDSFDPAQAIDGAARLMRDHLRTFGSTELALAAYNAGPGAVRRFNGIPPYAETQNYVRKITANLSSAGVTA